MSGRTKPPKPKIIPRKSWGARPGWGTVYPPPLSATYYRATAHHTAGYGPVGMTLDAALAEVKAIQEYHMFRAGYSDIGYHRIIAPGGQIIEGRPLNVQGAHTYLENGGNVGYCLLGKLHERQPTPQQLESLKAIYTWDCWELNLQSSCLKGHMDYMPTQCPGSLQKYLPEIHEYAKKALTGQIQPAPPEPPQPTSPSLTLDGKLLGDVLIVDGVSYAPVRVLATALGLSTGFDPATKTVSLTSDPR